LPDGALRNLIEAFTPRRCFWGTDLSVMLTRSTCTYPQAVKWLARKRLRPRLPNSAADED
jgi:hypothetical protein